MNYLWIGLGGFMGANARYLVAVWSAGRWGTAFPYGTLLANVAGSFLIAFFLTLATERLAVPTEIRLFFAVGFVGSFTTFSTFAYETFHLAETTGWQLAVMNFLADTMLGLIAVLLGIVLARWLAG